jgi:hypothetical protein
VLKSHAVAVATAIGPVAGSDDGAARLAGHPTTRDGSLELIVQADLVAGGTHLSYITYQCIPVGVGNRL